MKDIICPYCENKLVKPSGPKDSKILVIGEFPGWEEVIKLRPFVGEAGGVLRAELGRLGVDLNALRVTNLWLHETNKDADCKNFSFQKCIEEAAGRQAILLLGSECAKYFVDKPVSDIAGLRVESPYLSAKIIICSPNPAIVLREGQTVGEVRLSLKRFVVACEKEGLL